jgi:hypothetical protein
MKYRYRKRKSQQGTYTSCIADDPNYQTKMIGHLMKLCSQLFEAEKRGAKKGIFKATLKVKNTKKDSDQKYMIKKNNKNQSMKKTFQVKDFINTPSERLCKPAKNGYGAQPKQSPGQFLSGQMGKFADILADPDSKHLSPEQIKFFNRCAGLIIGELDKVINEEVWFEKDGKDHCVRSAMNQGKWFFDILKEMYIDAVDLDKQDNDDIDDLFNHLREHTK